MLAPSYNQSASIREKVHNGSKGALLKVTERSGQGIGAPLDSEAFAVRSTNVGFRRMTWGVLVNEEEEFATSLAKLKESIKCEARGITFIAARTSANTIVLLSKPIDTQLLWSQSWEGFKLKAEGPIPLARALMDCARTIFTMQLNIEEEVKHLEAEDVIKPFIKMDPVKFKAHIINLQEKKKQGDTLTAEERFLLAHIWGMVDLKKEMQKKES